MICKKCKLEIPDESKFCNHCGAKQIREKSTKKRGNGQGTVYKDQNGKWVAEYTIGWDEVDGKLNRKMRRKKGFATKNEALAYMPNLKQDLPQQDMNVKFKDLYKKWLDGHTEKVTQSTINCYKSAYKYFTRIYYVEISKIRTEHLQKCIDECPHGRRTKENMKALGTSLWKYAMQLDLVDRNYAEYIYIKKEEVVEKVAFSKAQLDTMWAHVDSVPNIKFVLLLCYTGMRLSEMLGATTANYYPDEGYFITGIKTEAGKNRTITISPKIKPFFADFGKGKHLFTDLSDKKFRNDVFYPALQAVGMDVLNEKGDHVYTPHCCRHTFATLMKNVDAPATDKQKLIGHAKFEMTAHYTHTDIESLKKITDNL
jgi:integrase/ribosomal protein L40E